MVHSLLVGWQDKYSHQILLPHPAQENRIYNTVYQRCRQQRQLIIDNFPKLNRFLTGYDLRHVFNDEMTEFDLTRILTGLIEFYCNKEEAVRTLTCSFMNTLL